MFSTVAHLKSEHYYKYSYTWYNGALDSKVRDAETRLYCRKLYLAVLTLSSLNKIMDNSNTALWTIPNFEFGYFFTFALHFINIFKQNRPWSEGSYRSPLIWVWTLWKTYMDSLQRAIGLKGLSNHFYLISIFAIYNIQSNLDIWKLMGLFFTSSNYPKCKFICTSGNLDL